MQQENDFDDEYNPDEETGDYSVMFAFLGTLLLDIVTFPFVRACERISVCTQWSPKTTN